MEGDLREDEIEALLKFEGSQLAVYNDVEDGSWNYTAMIHISTPPIKVLSCSHESRIDAIRGVWAKYNRYKEDQRRNSFDVWWLEEAKANVEIKLHELRQNNYMIKPKGKSKWLK